MNDSISLGFVEETLPQTRPERADAAANRALILTTAEALFAKKGVATVCMAEIAKAAGVGKGTLYRRFANKAELCLALMDTQMREFQDAMLSRMRQMNNEGVPPLHQLDLFMDALVHFVADHIPLLTEVEQEEVLTDHFGDQRRPYFWQHMTITGLLRTAQMQGTCAADVDVEYTADALLAPLNTHTFNLQREARGFSLERMSSGLRRLITGLHA